jgi:hypothetical protein
VHLEGILEADFFEKQLNLKLTERKKSEAFLPIFSFFSLNSKIAG